MGQLKADARSEQRNQHGQPDADGAAPALEEHRR